jgi:hypothetical protein
VLPPVLVISPPTLCKFHNSLNHLHQTNRTDSGGLASGVEGTAEGILDAGRGVASGVGSLAGGLVDAGKGVLGGVGDALGGVFGVGGDLVEAITGLRPWRATDIEQLNEIRAAIRPITRRYAARQ